MFKFEKATCETACGFFLLKTVAYWSRTTIKPIPLGSFAFARTRLILSTSTRRKPPKPHGGIPSVSQ